LKRALVLCVLASSIACKKSRPPASLIGGMGTRIAGGVATDLRVSPDGKIASFLKESQKPRLEGVPPTMRVGELFVVPTAGGEPHKLGNGVSNYPGGYLFTPDSKWVLELVGFNAATQVGELDIAPADGSGEAHKLGSQVSYMLASPDTRWVAFVDEGILKLGPLPKGPFRDINGEVANAEFSPDSKYLFFKRRGAAGGGLLRVSVADGRDVPKKLGELVGEYRITPDGKRIAFSSKSIPSDRSFRLYVADTATLKDQKVSDGVFDFRFTPDGKQLARLEGTSPEAGGDFFIENRQLGTGVRDFAFSPDQKKVAWRESYVPDRAEGLGTLMYATLPRASPSGEMGGQDGPPKLVGRRARSFEWAPDSKSIAFTFDVVKPLRSVNLYLYPLELGEAVHIKDWAYDYDFTPQSDRLLFRADCTREGRACNLLSIDVAKPKEPPKKLIEGVFGFRLSTDGARALYTYARLNGDLYDTGVLNLKSGEYKTLEQQVRMPPYFLDDSGTKVAYIVAEQKREGVYVADKVP
jgi:hypothetical protein